MSRPGWVPDELFPFESKFAEIGGARVHYVDEGSGPPLLLLHGNPTWSFLYRDIIKKYNSGDPAVGLSSDATPNADFASGEVAQFITGPWAVPTLTGQPVDGICSESYRPRMSETSAQRCA